MSLPRRSQPAMGTIVTIQVLSSDPAAVDAMDRAFGWFEEIEERCTRFRPDSELMSLTQQAGVAVKVSPILFEALRFAVMLAEETGGAFDPTIGRQMELSGFNREYRTGQTVDSGPADTPAGYCDIELDPGCM